MESYEVECPHCGSIFAPMLVDVLKVEEDEHGLIVHTFIVAGIDDPGLSDSFRLPKSVAVEEPYEEKELIVEPHEHAPDEAHAADGAHGHMTLVKKTRTVFHPKDWTPQEIRLEALARAKARIESRKHRDIVGFQTKYEAAIGRIR